VWNTSSGLQEQPTMTHPRKRILLIDDNFVTQEMLSLTLAAEGYMVVTAANGQEAIARLQKCEPVDVILLDLSMPVMDGQHFRDAQRADDRLANIPTIVFSGSEDAEGTAAALGVVGCLRKPVTTAELLDMIQHCCNPSHTA
jgi:CheY-like chemotaxis protein